MTEQIVNILEMPAADVMEHFLRSEQYHGFELPDYFDFDKVLAFVKETIGDRKYEDCVASATPDELPNVNLDILMNKDGHYAVRPIVLANPYLYYFLVREICSAEGWESVKKCFKAYKVPHIQACALPVVPINAEPFHKSATILHWWNSIEQQSIDLSLQYRYMFVTDITNCYGSINPQSIAWALACKGTEHENDDNRQMAKNIQTYLRALQHGHNIGIPQGSAIFDLVSEIILGYSDLLLHEALKKEGIEGYEILRYRDDYRVFCNDKDTLERISYILQSVLENLNFRMNSQKTKISDSIVTDSIKPDKLFYIFNTPIFNKKGCDFDSFEKHLIFILMFGRKYPNSGQLKNMLNDINKRMEKWLKDNEKEMKVTTIPMFKGEELVTRTVKYYKLLPGGSVRTMCAVCLQIAMENIAVSHYALQIISRLIDSLSHEEKNKEEQEYIIQTVRQKLCNQPNSNYTQLWLQNMSYAYDKQQGKSPYTMRLCKLVMDDYSDPLWNNSWLKPSLTTKLPYDTIVNQEILSISTPVIKFRERRIYDEVWRLWNEMEEQLNNLSNEPDVKV